MAAKFLTDLILRPGDSGEWVLDEALEYLTGAGKVVTVPAGYITDLASIPIGLRNLFPINGNHRKAAVVHDFLYSDKSIKREVADAIFLEAMGISGVSNWRAQLMYRAVRWFGWMVRK